MSLHVERTGRGPPLALLHGWAMHSGAWRESLAGLCAGFDVHAVDLPGHGGSAQAAERHFDAAVDAVAEALPEGCIVCGWSLGGLVALALALRHPRRVRALALVATTPCFVQRPGWEPAMSTRAFEQFASGFRHDPPRALAEFVRLNAVGGARSREAIRDLGARLAERGPPAHRALEASLDWLRAVDLRAAAGAAAQETVLLHGARDALAPVEAARWLAGALPRARLVELGDAAHVPFYSHREAFLETLAGLR